MKHVKDKMIPAVLILVLLVIWEAAVDLLHIPLYVLPSPLEVVKALFTEGAELFSHGLTTVGEGLLGILIASALSLVLGISMDWFPAVRKGLYPILVGTQTVPMIVMAPILIIYMGFGMAPKILTVVLMCFFPVAVSFADGLQRVDEEYVHLVRSYGADRWKAYCLVKIPGSAAGTVFRTESGSDLQHQRCCSRRVAWFPEGTWLLPVKGKEQLYAG